MKTWELLLDYHDLKTGYKDIQLEETTCIKCKYLFEIYERTPKSNKDYWIMTELFALLHDSDECKGKEEL